MFLDTLNAGYLDDLTRSKGDNMTRTEAFLLDYINRKVWPTSKREFMRDVVSVGFNKFRLAELYNLDAGEYADLLEPLDTIRAYVCGKNLATLEIQMILARFARVLTCSDLDVDLVHELNDDAWAVIEALDYISALEEV